MTHHFLEVVFSAQQYKRGEQIGPGAVVSGHGVNMNVGGAGAGAGIANARVAVQQQTAAVGGNALKEQILNFIRVEGDGSDIGAPMDRCITLLQQNGFSEPQVRTAVEELSSEGHIYSTIDENHYQFAF